MVGTEKENPDEDDDTGAVGAKLKGAAEEDAAGAEQLEETDVRGMFGNAAGAEATEAAGLAGWVAKEPGFGCLSPSKVRAVDGETSCFTPGFRLRRANGQINPSVDSISIVGAGGKLFSSVIWISCWLV